MSKKPSRVAQDAQAAAVRSRMALRMLSSLTAKVVAIEHELRAIEEQLIPLVLQERSKK